MFKTGFNISEIDVFPLLGSKLSKGSYCQLDLSVSNKDKDFQQVNSVESLQNYIDQILDAHDVSIGIGGYREKRNLYQRFDHFNDDEEPRCYHLGVDVWTKAGTPLYLPIKGEVVNQSIIDLDGDYGGLIIIKHDIQGEIFHSLYGHLSHDSIGVFEIGQQLTKGTIIARLGDRLENGGWPPHLHFQIIKDLGEYRDDYPGVCTVSEKDYFFKNCPDPNFLLT
jgi:murein DD-endopeptidase MepM/ murein hydrolase activator NlpD